VGVFIDSKKYIFLDIKD
jgi:hypothetical protein